MLPEMPEPFEGAPWRRETPEKEEDERELTLGDVLDEEISDTEEAFPLDMDVKPEGMLDEADDDEDITEWMKQDDSPASGAEEGAGTRVGPKFEPFGEGVPEGLAPEDLPNPSEQGISDEKMDRLLRDPTMRQKIRDMIHGIEDGRL